MIYGLLSTSFSYFACDVLPRTLYHILLHYLETARCKQAGRRQAENKKPRKFAVVQEHYDLHLAKLQLFVTWTIRLPPLGKWEAERTNLR